MSDDEPRTGFLDSAAADIRLITSVARRFRLHHEEDLPATTNPLDPHDGHASHSSSPAPADPCTIHTPTPYDDEECP